MDPSLPSSDTKYDKNKYTKYNEYTQKQNYRLKSHINFIDHTEIKDSKDTKYESSYLTNVNDFSIKEASQINNRRIIKFEKKMPRYTIV